MKISQLFRIFKPSLAKTHPLETHPIADFRIPGMKETDFLKTRSKIGLRIQLWISFPEISLAYDPKN